MSLVRTEACQVLAIDMQDKLLPSIANADAMIGQAKRLIGLASELSIGCSLSEHYTKGLGQTPETIRSHFSNGTVFEKISFSCLGDAQIESHFASLREAGASQIILLGMETHICVLQTAFDFLSRGWEVFLAIEATSARSQDYVTLAKTRMEQAGVQVLNSEMIIFEWLKKAGTPEFKRALPYIKQ